jgi:hypothetical protein
MHAIAKRAAIHKKVPSEEKSLGTLSVLFIFSSSLLIISDVMVFTQL